VDGDQGRVRGLGVAQAVDEVEPGRGDGVELAVLGVAAGEGVCDSVRGAGPILDGEVEAEKSKSTVFVASCSARARSAARRASRLRLYVLPYMTMASRHVETHWVL
jgi:hypothetical protein